MFSPVYRCLATTGWLKSNSLYQDSYNLFLNSNFYKNKYGKIENNSLLFSHPVYLNHIS